MIRAAHCWWREWRHRHTTKNESLPNHREDDEEFKPTIKQKRCIHHALFDRDA